MRYVNNGYAHVQVFDSVEDILTACGKARPSKILDGASLYRESWVGRDFTSWQDVYSSARQPWDEGVEIVERMVAELESIGLPKPKSRKRKSRFSEDDGDELDYDRLRTGQAFWRRCQRENMAGPQTVTLVVDVSTRGSVAHEDILWRGAAAIAITKVLEEAGFRVELWMARCSNKYGRDGLGTVVGVNLKRAGDPLDIATLIAAVSGWFFRSVVIKSETIHATPRNHGLGNPRMPTEAERLEITGTPDSVLVANVYDEYAATWLAKSIIKRLAGIEDPPPPPPKPEVEPVISEEPTPEPAAVEPPKSAAQIRLEQIAQRKAERQWKRYWKQRERENISGRK